MESETFLRRVLLADAAICAGFGILSLALRGLLTGPFALPGPLVSWAAAVVFAAGALMVVTAMMRPLRPGLVRLVIAGNAGWVIASLGLALAGVAGTSPGTLFIAVQALGVMGLTALEWRGFRGITPRTA